MRTIDDGNRIKAKQELEEDLQRLVEFGNEWLLQFEPKKTQGLTISQKHDRINNPEIKMDGTTIKEEKAIKVLGFIIDQKGTWEKQINSAVSDTRSRVGALARIKHYFDDQGLIIAYKAFVRSKLE